MGLFSVQVDHIFTAMNYSRKAQDIFCNAKDVELIREARHTFNKMRGVDT